MMPVSCKSLKSDWDALLDEAIHSGDCEFSDSVFDDPVYGVPHHPSVDFGCGLDYEKFPKMDALQHALLLNLCQSFGQLQPLTKPIINKTDKVFRTKDLDSICLPVFRQDPFADASTMELVAKVFCAKRGILSEKKVCMAVKRWFRVRRDTLGKVVFSACHSILLPLLDGGLKTRKEIMDDIVQRSALFQKISSLCPLSIDDPEENDRFLIEKIKAFLKRRSASL